MPRSPTSTNALEPKALAQRLHLIGHGAGIARIARIHLHRHGTALAVGQHSVDDDRQPLLAIPVMAEQGQRTTLPV